MLDLELLTPEERDVYDYLARALPQADAIMLDDAGRLALIRQMLLVRRETPWGRSIPEDLFRAYVLFPRVNNEDLAFYQPVLWAQLRARVADKTMGEAALEVNRWCCENASYRATDDRTLNALSVLRRTYGRCGEESTLLVSALRSVGIPARQVYVPRWAHCDDNHAWVEAWTDGAWHYLGACEPEPVLDSGWFTAAASKAPFIHTHAYGILPEGERIEKTEDGVATINRTASYAQTATVTVCVTLDGAPLPGVTVRFELANYGEFFPLIAKETDGDGRAELVAGLGTLRVHVHDGRRFAAQMLHVQEATVCRIDFGAAAEDMAEPEAFVQQPPIETRIQPFIYPAQVQADHERMLRRCEAFRTARMAAFHTQNDWCAAACGNYEAIEAFLSTPAYAEEDRYALLDLLRPKDLVDSTQELLTDALDAALPARDRYPDEVWRESVLNPRVADEMLYPVRGEVRAWFAGREVADMRQLARLLRERLAIGAAPDARLVPDARAMLRHGFCPGERVFDILLVICARALGMAARLDLLTGQAQTWTGNGYRALDTAQQPEAAIRLINASGRELHYGTDFTVGVLAEGVYRTLRVPDAALREEMTLPVAAGAYRLMTCTRQISGAVDGLLTPVRVRPGETCVVQVRTAPERMEDLLVRAPLPALHAYTAEGTLTDLSAGVGSGAIIALVAPGQEPTEHFFNELLENREELAARSVAVRLAVQKPEELAHAKLRAVLREVPDTQVFCGVTPEDELVWRQLMHAGDLRLPFETAVNSRGEGLFSFVNYHVGSVRALLRTFDDA